MNNEFLYRICRTKDRFYDFTNGVSYEMKNLRLLVDHKMYIYYKVLYIFITSKLEVFLVIFELNWTWFGLSSVH